MENEAPRGDNASEQLLPEKLRGKSADEIARMYTELESSHGRLANEVGTLRETVNVLQAQPVTSSPEPDPYRTAGRFDRVREYAEELITRPDEAAPRLADDIAADVERRLSTKLTFQSTVTNFVQADEELRKFPEVFGVAADEIARHNPKLPLDLVLKNASARTKQWIASARERLTEGRDDRRLRDVVTTSGGIAREAVGATESAGAQGPLDPQRQAVLDYVAEQRERRATRLVPR